MSQDPLKGLRRPWASPGPSQPGFVEGFQESIEAVQRDNVTLFSDASFDKATGDMGGGWWAKFGGHKVQGRSRRREVHSSAEAEVRVLVGAILRLLDHPEFREWRRGRPAPHLIAVVDALSIRDAFNRPGKALGLLTLHVQDRLKVEGIHITFNHVKAHNPDGTPRAYVNQWCDETARAARLSLRDTP